MRITLSKPTNQHATPTDVTLMRTIQKKYNKVLSLLGIYIYATIGIGREASVTLKQGLKTDITSAQV